jgi:Na+-driven multidrug efflux pump
MRFAKDVIKLIVNISLPVSFQNLLILIGFLSFVAITGIVGTTEQAASQVVITALFMSFLPCFGLGIAAQTLVGQMLGRDLPERARAYGFATAKLATLFTIGIGALFVFLPEAVLIVVTTDRSVIQVARPVLQIAGVAQAFYGSGIIYANALQAAGETLYVMIVEVITHWVLFLPCAFLFGITLGGGILGAWLALPLYILVYSSLNFLKFRSTSWMAKRI